MQKMVLLPYDRYQRFLSSKQTNETSVAESRQENLSEPFTSTPPESATHVTTSDLEAPETSDIERVVSSFPKTLQSRARALLTYISPSVTWNEKGEIIIRGDKIPNSNIVDLVKVQIKDYKNLRPIGLEQFSDILKDTNVPLSLLTSSRRGQTGQGIAPSPPSSPVKRKKARKGPVPPPPGSPVKRKDTRKVKWLRL